MRRFTVAVIFGTRPEGIKLAPVILEMQAANSELRPLVCVTGQHREMLDQVLNWFRISADHDLNLMQANQTLAELSARALISVNKLLGDVKPDAVVIQGDTTTAAIAGLAAFYLRIPVAHVEAGLRTGDIYSPFPEEVNRRITGLIAGLHFAPTTRAASALLAEKVDPNSVFTVGNTVIDALRLTLDRKAEIETAQGLSGLNPQNRMVLVTAHRRESFGSPFERICRSIRKLVEQHPDIEVVYPVHLNPNVRDPVSRILKGTPRIHLIEPTNYQQFVALMSRSYFILTDSGGVQEEAAALGKPTLIMRDNTERPEAVAAGTAALVGTEEETILAKAETLLKGGAEYRKMCHPTTVFGDGFSAQSICKILRARLAGDQRPMLELKDDTTNSQSPLSPGTSRGPGTATLSQL